MATGMAFLMYHEIERPGSSTAETAAGYLRYVVTESNFREHVNVLRRSGYTAISVGQALVSPRTHGPRVVLTFDDGAASDRMIAAPLLKENGFGATFYVVAGFLDRSGYLTSGQLRELAGLGFEIGSHSMSHRWLTGLDAAALHNEIVDSKDVLQRVLGGPVHHFACPGGRLSKAALRLAKEAGYLSLATSQVGLNDAGTDPFGLRRIAIHRGTRPTRLLSLCRGRGLAFRRARENVLHAAKTVMGNSRYDRLRTMLLEHTASA
jgi:peptidoglycan/xylan/chitin deacetylase (PgdA/CDA1 family)